MILRGCITKKDAYTRIITDCNKKNASEKSSFIALRGAALSEVQIFNEKPDSIVGCWYENDQLKIETFFTTRDVIQFFNAHVRFR